MLTFHDSNEPQQSRQESADSEGTQKLAPHRDLEQNTASGSIAVRVIDKMKCLEQEEDAYRGTRRRLLWPNQVASEQLLGPYRCISPVREPPPNE